jgi:hypothetical protein
VEKIALRNDGYWRESDLPQRTLCCKKARWILGKAVTVCVHIVTDTNFGERLGQIAPAEPIWVIQSSANNAVVAVLREQGRDMSTFVPGYVLDDLLSVIREHHPGVTRFRLYTEP